MDHKIFLRLGISSLFQENHSELCLKETEIDVLHFLFTVSCASHSLTGLLKIKLT